MPGLSIQEGRPHSSLCTPHPWATPPLLGLPSALGAGRGLSAVHTALQDGQAGGGALSSPHLGPPLARLKLRFCVLLPAGPLTGVHVRGELPPFQEEPEVAAFL